MSSSESGGDDKRPWAFAVAAFLGVTLLNEVLGYLSATRSDWAGFFYVTLKFIVLPAAAICGVGAVGWRTITRRALTWPLLAGGTVGLAYLVALYLYPLPWL